LQANKPIIVDTNILISALLKEDNNLPGTIFLQKKLKKTYI